MAAPTYATDLTGGNEITTAETTTGWSAYGGGGAGLSASPDMSMQGTNCVDKQVSNADKGAYFDNGSGVTLGAGDHVFVWLFNGTPGLCDSLANRGASILIGSSSGNYCQYHVEGNNTYGAQGRVGKCYPIDYTTRTASTGFRSVTGSPAANPQVFGGGLVTTASVKAANVGIDAIRFGLGIFITAGDGTTPATFAGAAAQNDAVANRWGVFTETVSGKVYELQGKFTIGQNTSLTPTAAQFSDTDAVINIVDTPHSASNFTQIIIDHASTIVDWTNVTILVAGTNNVGSLLINNASSTVNFTNVLFGDGFGTSSLKAATTATNCKWVNCNTATLGGATIDACVFESTPVTLSGSETITDSSFLTLGSTLTANGVDFTGCTIISTAMTLDSGVVLTNTYYQNLTNTTLTQSSATITGCTFSSLNINNTTSVITSNNPALITDCYFEESFSNNAGIEITATGTYTWDNITYDTNRWASGGGSNPTPSSGLATSFVYNNSGGLVTLNLANGSTIPTVRNGAGATTVVNAGNTTVTLTGLKPNTEVTVYENDSSTVVDTVENSGTSFAFSAPSASVVDIRIHHLEYYSADILDYTIPATATSIPIAQQADPNYVNN